MTCLIPCKYCKKFLKDIDASNNTCHKCDRKQMKRVLKESKAFLKSIKKSMKEKSK